MAKARRGAVAGAATTLLLALTVLGPTPPAVAQGGLQFGPRYSQLVPSPLGDAWGQCGPAYPDLFSNAPIVAIALTHDNAGCWMTGSDGGVFAYGDAPFYGSIGGTKTAAPVVGMAVVPDGGGYWLVGADGGVFGFGDARYLGSLPGDGIHVSDIVGMAVSPSGQGYWLVGADGGVFAFGDAPFYGSLPSMHIAPAESVVAVGASPDGGGYWLVGADGGVFGFGDARFQGSMGGQTLDAPVTAMAVDQATGGYWLLAADGGVFAFNAPFEGSEHSDIGPQPNPFTAVAATEDGGGYELLPSDPAVEPGVAGRSGFDLARQEWVGDGTLSCADQDEPLVQGAQYLLIGERADDGDTSRYPTMVDKLEQLSILPEMGLTSTESAEASADTAALNAFFGTNAGVPCS